MIGGFINFFGGLSVSKPRIRFLTLTSTRLSIKLFCLLISDARKTVSSLCKSIRKYQKHPTAIIKPSSAAKWDLMVLTLLFCPTVRQFASSNEKPSRSYAPLIWERPIFKALQKSAFYFHKDNSILPITQID